MVEKSLVPIAFSEKVNIYCPAKGRFSFFNSPYPAHHLYTGIDVYTGDDFNGIAPSPVMGRIIKTRRIKCPKGKGFKDHGFDFLILLRSNENPRRFIKILHVEPIVENGSIVEPGDELGKLIRSGYFSFWTDPHIHIEVKDPSDPFRVRGGFKFKGRLKIDVKAPDRELKGRVVETKPEYSLVALNARSKHGVSADVGGSVGFLDGGIPHYDYVGAHVIGKPQLGGVLKLCGKPLARIESVHHNMCLAKYIEASFKVNGVDIGLSLFLSPSFGPIIKLVPSKPGELTLKISEPVSISISNVIL